MVEAVAAEVLWEHRTAFPATAPGGHWVLPSMRVSGTLAYLAPKVYAGTGYLTEVDWWTSLFSARAIRDSCLPCPRGLCWDRVLDGGGLVVTGKAHGWMNKCDGMEMSKRRDT